MSKDFIVYFFEALTKCEIWMKYEKCMASVLYFVVYFAKILPKYPQNAKCDKSIPGLMRSPMRFVDGTFKTSPEIFHRYLLYILITFSFLHSTLLLLKWCAWFFGDAKRVIWQEYLLKGATINTERYRKIIKNLRKTIKRKRLGLLIEGVILLHDNVQPHSANVTQELLQQFQWDAFRHPLYSSNLAPSDFALFPALKVVLVGEKFSNDEEVKTFTQNYFTNLGTQFYTNRAYKNYSRGRINAWIFLATMWKNDVLERNKI